jgi:starch phosphorylase
MKIPGPGQRRPLVVYFSMEVGLESEMPTYSGGLGVLAGDNLRAAADLGVQVIGMTLLYRKGYFRQHLDANGNQSESPVIWSPEEFLEPLTARTTVMIEGRTIQVRPWRYTIPGVNGSTVPVYFLDTDLPENSDYDRSLTDYLYGGDTYYRLCQEIVLGFGGIKMLRALEYRDVHVYHMNEGHSAFLGLALINERAGKEVTQQETISHLEAVRQQCVFTTHTPVPAGQDRFAADMVRRALGDRQAALLEKAGCFLDGTLNMTHMALVFSSYINGVSMRHEEISRGMFPSYPINSVTNGVNSLTWTALPFQQLYDKHIPEWRYDNLYLRYAIGIPLSEIQQAHTYTKRELLLEVEHRSGVTFDRGVLTIGFARRATAYKRANLLFADIDRLKAIAGQSGTLQVIYAGKAHPRDGGGKDIIRAIFSAASALKDSIKIVYLEEYDIALAKLMVAGVDVWLNTPLKPDEASGTSGMKAALNGVPSLSVLDGWWVEGCFNGVTGWSIGERWEPESDPAKEISSLYDKLKDIILPMFYNRPDEFAAVMRSAIAINGSYFNAERMVLQYYENAYSERLRQSAA